MVKAKEFMDYLCNKLEFRLFTGVPCIELKSIYNVMDSKIMHYIPAVNERVAIGIAAGATMTGFNSAVLISSEKFGELKPILDFVHKTVDTGLLFIVGGSIVTDEMHAMKINKNFVEQLNTVYDSLITNKSSVIVSIKEGLLL